MEEAQQVFYRGVVLGVLRRLEGDINVLSNSVAAATTTETNGIEDQNATRQTVSIVIENYLGFRNLSENVDIAVLQDEWPGESVIRRTLTPQINENVSEGYLATLTLQENIIVLRFINDYRQHVHGFQSFQIIWNSRFSWREIIEHVEHNTYSFNFRAEHIQIGNNNGSVEVNVSPRDIVDGLPDVIIRLEDNGNDDEVLCAVCYETFRNGETAKQLECRHVFHSNCILQWFTHKINCPTCRYEPAPRRR